MNPKIDKNKLLESGASYKGMVDIEDTYLRSPYNQRIFRLRKEGSRYYFGYKTEDRSYSFGIRIGYDLFDGFSKKTNYSRAKLTAMTARESYQNEINALNSQVRQAYLDYEKSRLQLEVAELGARSAEEDMKLQQERYRLGASSILELLDAQVSLTQSQSNLVQAYFDLNKAIADIAKATGGR